MEESTHVLECIAVRAEAADVKTFRFRAPAPERFRYLPGQFVTLELPTGPEPLLRTYTLSSSPSRPLTLAVTVKATPDSVGSRWMLDGVDCRGAVKYHMP